MLAMPYNEFCRITVGAYYINVSDDRVVCLNLTTLVGFYTRKVDFEDVIKQP
jgi:hypothetical protein